jgi:hypothetical protein
MCTCGMAMATQQATLATHSNVCAAPGVRPKGRLLAVAARPLLPTVEATATGGRLRINSASAVIVTKLKMPKPR